MEVVAGRVRFSKRVRRRDEEGVGGWRGDAEEQERSQQGFLGPHPRCRRREKAWTSEEPQGKLVASGVSARDRSPIGWSSSLRASVGRK